MNKLMLKWTSLSLVALLSIGLMSGCGDNDATSNNDSLSTTERQTVEQTVDDLVTSMSVPGVLVSIQKKGKDIYRYGSGYADTANGVMMGKDDYVRVGSISKTYGAMTVLILAQEGVLGLDDPISKWIPGVLDSTKYNEDEITIRHLLNHTSGVFNFTNDEDFLISLITYPTATQWTPSELLNVVNSHDAAGSLGEWHYSNTNTILAALIIEEATGKTYSEVMKEKVLDPLGLDHTILPDTGDYMLPDPHANGYYNTYEMYGVGDDVLFELSEIEPSTVWSSGAVVSTLEDMARWVRAMGECELLTTEMCEQQYEFVQVAEGSTTYSGLGIFREEADVPGYVGHRGQIFGFDCSMQYNQSEETAIVGCVNKSRSAGTNEIISTLDGVLFPDATKAAVKRDLVKTGHGLLDEY